jgi:exopolysaccharide biosynthesis predicted pyruvyltransferase EpsI
MDTHTRTSQIRLHHAELSEGNLLARPDELFSMRDEPGHDALCEREQALLLRAIREDLDLGEHMADAVSSLRIVLAADESVRTGQVVAL